MGPRGEHSREEFTALVTDAAEAIVRREGAGGLGMRPVASAIGYAPNSIYNAIGGVPEMVMHVNARTLVRLRDRLAAAAGEGGVALPTILRLADAYLDFVQDEPQLWSLLLEYTLPADTVLPPWFLSALSSTSDVVAHALEPTIADPAERARTVTLLWAGLQGIAALGRSGKLRAVIEEEPRVLAHLLVRRVLGE